MRRCRAVAGVAAPLALSLLLVGCQKGSASKPAQQAFAGSDIERTIENQLAPQLQQKGLTAGAASCPAKVSPTADRPGACTLQVEGQPTRIKVVRSGTGFQVSVDQVVVNIASFEALAEHEEKQKYTFNCGSETAKVINVGGTVDCLATPQRKGGAVQFVATFSDLAGHFTLQPKTTN
ncbi:MAG: hypothetical protein DLM56_13070 [Pseudonocardiales bacterium]|nr:MAG: hypothetical protein DLM56_13070 [Pseudonocardiales bacterium]